MSIDPSIGIHRGASRAIDPAAAAAELHAAIGKPGVNFAIFYCSADYDLPALARELEQRFAGITLVGCTSAGEITPFGYLSGALTGVGFAAPELTIVSKSLRDLSNFNMAAGEQLARELKLELESKGLPARGGEAFAFLLVDGLSRQEEPLVHALSRGLGDIELFGGSAGDGARFEHTHVYCDGTFTEDVATLCLIHSTLPFLVFKTQHFESTDTKMVVTKADPAQRLVYELNGEPAGREYARILGFDADRLEPTVFAAHPVVVKLGGQIYVRSIMRMNEDESLSFACAIDEGIVVSVARPLDLVGNLEELFERIEQTIGHPTLTLGCDCLFRSIEMDQRGIKEQVSEVLTRNNVVGFSTYGEQYNSMHVNQTFTGVAIGSRRAA